jgi:hypothetical protein
VLELIGELYGIEAHIRGKPVAERLRVRQEKSVPLLAAIKAWMTDKLTTLSKKSELAKAIRYSLNQWDALVLYGEEGRAEISNALRLINIERPPGRPIEDGQGLQLSCNDQPDP